MRKIVRYPHKFIAYTSLFILVITILMALVVIFGVRGKNGAKAKAAAPPAFTIGNVTQVAQEIGPSGNNSTQNVDVCGSDLGSMFDWNGKTYSVFGDTFGITPTGCDLTSSQPNWRSNTMAVSSDTNPADGMTFSNWITGPDGKAKQLFPKDAGAITAIPTYGVAIASINTAYLYYMEVINWTPWTCSYSSVVKSTDGGQNWTRVAGLTWNTGNFNQVGIYKSAGYVYFYGIPCGRQGGVKMMRVLEGSIENQAAYEYLTGYDASSNPVWTVNAESSAINIVGAPVGELSVRWDNYLGQYIMMYLHDTSPYTIELRSAPNLWGPWSGPQTVIDGNTYPCLYAPFTKEGYEENNGQTVYFRMSRFCNSPTPFTPYSTYWMKMSFNITQTPGSKNYVALGDSISSGYGLASSDYNKAWVPLYNGYLATDYTTPTTFYNLGIPSLSSSMLLAKLQTDSVFKSVVANADYITIDTGTVDWFMTGKWGGCSSASCFDPMLATFKSNFDAILNQIKTLNTKSNLSIRVMNLYDPYVVVDASIPIRDMYLLYMNQYINNEINHPYYYQIADVHIKFNGVTGATDPNTLGYLQADGLHPSILGHSVIANQFRVINLAQPCSVTHQCVTAGSPIPSPAPSINLTGTSSCQPGGAVVKLTWTQNTSDTQFNIIKDGTAITSTITSSGTWTSGVENQGQTHNWQVLGIKSNVSSNAVSVKTATCPPTVSVTSPTDGSTVSRNSSVTMSATATDVVGVTKVEFYVNGNLICTDTATPYSCQWLVPGGKKGVSFILMAKAYDSASNTASSSVTVSSN